MEVLTLKNIVDGEPAMAAIDSLNSFLNALTEADKEKLRDLISNVKEQMFAARSEDARVRIVQAFIGDANDALKHK